MTRLFSRKGKGEREPTASAQPEEKRVLEKPAILSKAYHTSMLRSRMISPSWTPPNLFSGSKRGKRVARFDLLVLFLGVFVGILGMGAVLGLGIYDWFKNKHNYCLVLDENFDGPLNTDLWKHDVQVGGFGTGEFEWTTTSSNNSFTKDGFLHIVPTLTADVIGEAAMLNGYTVNLTDSKTCTAEPVPWVDRSQSLDLAEQAIGNADTNCQIRSNSSIGTIIPPVQSARLTTNGTFSMKYGRVEVRAKMPTGDWLWPAVWMMPRDSVYGIWPRSGEIDIFESKGNMPTSRSQLLANTMNSALHFGTESADDQFAKFRGVATLWRNFWNQGFHTFGLEWDEQGIWTWRESRANKVLITKFNEPFINKMPLVQAAAGNYIPGANPWSISNSSAAPFDQEFFLILNVAVGGTNGFFADVGQPWSNSDSTARRTFWNQRESWLPSWGDETQRAMQVDYVKAWKQC